MALGSTQPLTNMITRNIIGIFFVVKGGLRVGLTTLRADCLEKCGNLNISQPYWPPRPVTGIVLLFFFFTLSHRKYVTSALK
jgi:hypothetical protein